MRLQRELRDAIGDDNFVSYLKLEEAVNVRNARALDLVAIWAFEEGLEHRKLDPYEEP